MTCHSFRLQRLLYLFAKCVLFSFSFFLSFLCCFLSRICRNGLPSRKFDSPPSTHSHTNHSPFIFFFYISAVFNKINMFELRVSKPWSMGFEWHISADCKSANFPSSLPQRLQNLHRELGEMRNGRKGRNWTFCAVSFSCVTTKTESLFTSAKQSSLIWRSSSVPCVMLNGWITGIIFALAFHPSLQGGGLSLGAERGTWDDDNEGLPLRVRVIQHLRDSWRVGLRATKKTHSSQGQDQIVRLDLSGCWKVPRSIIWAQSIRQT